MCERVIVVSPPTVDKINPGLPGRGASNIFLERTMKTRLHTVLTGPLLMLLWTTSAIAGTIFNNNANPPTIFPYSDLHAVPVSQILADDFSLAAGQNTIGDVHWTGRYFGAPPTLPTDAFSIYVCGDASGPIGCVALTFSSGVTRTGPISSSGYYDYTVNVNPYPITEIGRAHV